MNGTGSGPVVGGDIDELFIRHRPSVVTYVRLAGASWQDAEDAAQEAFVRYINLPDTSTVRGPRSWLCAVARNIYVREAGWSRRRLLAEREAQHLDDGAAERPRDPRISTLTERLVKAVDRLPRRQREVVRLYLADVSVLESAEFMNISEATVRSNLRHAQNNLRRMLNPEK